MEVVVVFFLESLDTPGPNLITPVRERTMSTYPYFIW